MSRAVGVCLGLALIAVCSLEAFQPPNERTREEYQSSQAQASAVPADRAVLNKYCVTCHNQRLKTAGLTLDTLDPGEVAAGVATWEKVVKKLRSGAMPPPGAPRPDKATAVSLAVSLESALDRAAAEAPNPGPTAVHRLNRAE